MKQGWERKKLGDLCTIGDGNYSSKYPKASEFVSQGIAFLTATNLKNGTIVPDGIRYISKAQHSTLTKGHVIKDDLVIVVRGSSTGNNSILPKVYEGSNLNSQLAFLRIKNKKEVDSKYLFLVFNSPDVQREVLNTISGAAQPQLPNNKLLNIEIPLPSFYEQQRIVAILDKAIATIDKAKANTEQNLKNANELLENYLSELFKEGNWSHKYLNEISENLDSKRVPITQNKRKPGNIPYYGASGVVDYVATYIFDEDLLCVSEDGANLLARTYPIAFSISGKTWVNNHAHILRFPNVNSQKFVELYLNSIKLNDYVSGMAQPKLNQTMLNKIPIPFPSIQIQEDVVARVGRLSSAVGSLSDNYQKKIDLLAELRKSVLQMAFSGEFVTEMIQI